MLPLIFVSVESNHLTRVERASLSQQTCMELIFDGIYDKQFMQDVNGEIKEIQRWSGLVFTDMHVQYITFPFRRLLGSIATKWIPDKVRGVNFTSNFLYGTICLVGLPNSLMFLAFTDNDLSGSVDLVDLPESLAELHIEQNKF